jgi:cystathionine beta-lyase family protein involved in aluminum resistance
MKTQQVIDYMVDWLKDYCEKAGAGGYVVGISEALTRRLHRLFAPGQGKVSWS